MTQEEFKGKMEKIFPMGYYDAEEAHGKADDLMVEVLEDMGYDLSDFHDADIWYA